MLKATYFGRLLAVPSSPPWPTTTITASPLLHLLHHFLGFLRTGSNHKTKHPLPLQINISTNPNHRAPGQHPNRPHLSQSFTNPSPANLSQQPKLPSFNHNLPSINPSRPVASFPANNSKAAPQII
ncbi:hypothetical protein M0R45_034307 [Rubus argutus]|uniref:Uncharacterized protein n=1 Tax=Rubus argutus TaxID=59490 RepID=A0AAW1VV51_RUBAR